MVFVFAPNNIVETYPYTLEDLQIANPNVSFPVNISYKLAEEFYVYPVAETQQPPYNPITQNIVWVYPILVNGKWVQQWAVEDATLEEIVTREADAKQANKAQAMQLLTDTDWTQMPDVNLVNKDAFTFYRVAVRAIALNPPVVVSEWPMKPEEVWAVNQEDSYNSVLSYNPDEVANEAL